MALAQINLLTKEFQEPGVALSDVAVRWGLILGVLGCVLVGGWQYFSLFSLTGQEAALKVDAEQLKAKVHDIQVQVSLEDSIKKEQAQIQKLKTQASIHSTLAAMQAKVPPGAGFTTVSIKTGAVALNMEAPSFIAVEQMLNSLRQEKNFSKVDLQALSQDQGKPVVAQISLTYGNGGQGK